MKTDLDLITICNDHNIRLVKYSACPNALSEFSIDPKESGHCLNVGDKELFILYDDSRPQLERYFTVAHELGHALLGHLTYRHKNGHMPDYAEQEANIFAVSLLINEIICRYSNHAKEQLGKETK